MNATNDSLAKVTTLKCGCVQDDPLCPEGMESHELRVYGEESVA